MAVNGAAIPGETRDEYILRTLTAIRDSQTNLNTKMEGMIDTARESNAFIRQNLDRHDQEIQELRRNQQATALTSAHQRAEDLKDEAAEEAADTRHSRSLSMGWTVGLSTAAATLCSSSITALLMSALQTRR